MIAASRHALSLHSRVEEKKVDVQYVRTEEQIADVLTKSLGRVKFIEFREKLGVVDVKECHK